MDLHAGSKRNLTLVMDLYELTMSYNYFKQGNKDEYVYFDMYYRKNPDNGGFSIFAGLQQLIECIEHLHFSEGDIKYLRSLNNFLIIYEIFILRGQYMRLKKVHRFSLMNL